jgi:hypothetical protein
MYIQHKNYLRTIKTAGEFLLTFLLYYDDETFYICCHIFCVFILKRGNRSVHRVFCFNCIAGCKTGKSVFDWCRPAVGGKPGVKLLPLVGQGSRWSVVPLTLQKACKVHSHQFCDFDLISEVRFHYLRHRIFLSLATEYLSRAVIP